MVDVLLVLLTVLVVWVALVVGLGWVALRRARRGNRVTLSQDRRNRGKTRR